MGNQLVIENNVVQLELVVNSSGALELVINDPTSLILEINTNSVGPPGPPGPPTLQDLQGVTDIGNTTTDDIEITDLTSGFILPVNGSSPARRVRITASDDGFGNSQLILTDI